MTVGGLGLLASAAYLLTAATSSTGAHVVLGGCCTPLARLLSRLPPSTPRQISAVFKIVIGLAQCLSTLRSFSRVLWPEVFGDFIAAIDQFTVEVSLVSKWSRTHGYSTPPIPTQAYYLLTVALVHDRHAYGYYSCTYYSAYYGTHYSTYYGAYYGTY